MIDTTTPDRLIDAVERRRLVPYSDMHIWRLERAGRFPERVKLGPGRVSWSLREVEEWIEARKAERDSAKAPAAVNRRMIATTSRGATS